MNKHLFPVRALWVACASVCLAAAWLPNVSAQTPTSAASRPAVIRSADFIVAVVNSEPITNQEVQTLGLRLQREAQAQGRPVDAP
jgi:peptidyl-prolyl cis-trans isomerase SurA